ncbi:hypothetical protein NFI96_027612, partial [Prochilodus magdalenae]
PLTQRAIEKNTYVEIHRFRQNSLWNFYTDLNNTLLYLCLKITKPDGRMMEQFKHDSYLDTPIHSDIFFQEKLMLNGVDIKIRMIRNKDEFCLMRNDALAI